MINKKQIYKFNNTIFLFICKKHPYYGDKVGVFYCPIKDRIYEVNFSNNEIKLYSFGNMQNNNEIQSWHISNKVNCSPVDIAWSEIYLLAQKIIKKRKLKID